MTVVELLAAVGLPADTERISIVSGLDTALVDTLRSVVGYASAGRTPEAQALALLDERLRRPDTEGYLFLADGEDWVLVIADDETVLEIAPVSHVALVRDLRQHVHQAQAILRRLQGAPKRSSLHR